MKKPFRETKLGKFLAKIAPNILNIAGDLLPDAGVLGMVSNLIKKDKDISPDDKAKALSQAQEMYELEIKDRDSARKREVEVKKNRK